MKEIVAQERIPVQETETTKAVNYLLEAIPDLKQKLHSICLKQLPGYENLSDTQQELKLKEVYSEYIESIYPESTIQSFIYHGTPFGKSVLENGFDSNKKGATTKNDTAQSGYFFAFEKGSVEMHCRTQEIKYLAVILNTYHRVMDEVGPDTQMVLAKIKMLREEVLEYNQEISERKNKEYQKDWIDRTTDKLFGNINNMRIDELRLTAKELENEVRRLEKNFHILASFEQALKEIVEQEGKKKLTNIDFSAKNSGYFEPGKYTSDSLRQAFEVLFNAHHSEYLPLVVVSKVDSKKHSTFEHENRVSPYAIGGISASLDQKRYMEGILSRVTESISEGNDAHIEKKVYAPELVDMCVVFDNENVHIFGSKKDKGVFENWLGNKFNKNH